MRVTYLKDRAGLDSDFAAVGPVRLGSGVLAIYFPDLHPACPSTPPVHERAVLVCPPSGWGTSIPRDGSLHPIGSTHKERLSGRLNVTSMEILWNDAESDLTFRY